MTRPDTGQLAFEQFRNDIRKARAEASRDPRGEPTSGNATRPAPKAGNPDPEPPAEDPEEREALDRIHAEEAQEQPEPDPLSEAEAAEDHPDQDVPWP